MVKTTTAPVETEDVADITEAASVDKACACSEWGIDNYDDDGEYVTGCESPTRKTFAPGHDAKLKSLLIKAGVEGFDVTSSDGSFSGTAVSVASQYGFESQVMSGIDRAAAEASDRIHRQEAREAAKAKREQEKADKKAERAAAKEAAKAEKLGAGLEAARAESEPANV